VSKGGDSKFEDPERLDRFAETFARAIAAHRHFDREIAVVPA
jgi:hypothetical protein